MRTQEFKLLVQLPMVHGQQPLQLTPIMKVIHSFQKMYQEFLLHTKHPMLPPLQQHTLKTSLEKLRKQRSSEVLDT